MNHFFYSSTDTCGKPKYLTACPYTEVHLPIELALSPSKKSWFKDDSPNPLKYTSKILRSVDDLIFRPVHAFDAGRYTFRDTDDGGSRKGCTVYILSITGLIFFFFFLIPKSESTSAFRVVVELRTKMSDY